MRSLITLSVVLIILSFQIPVVSDSIGDFELDPFNDPPIFIDWYDSATLIPPDNSVTFHVLFNDIDNSSSELTVYLFYSNDSFAIYNNSYTMNFALENPRDTFRFTYLWPGQPYGTYFQYYYVLFDGSNYVKKPNEIGVYLDIQWDFAIQDPGAPADGYPKIREIFIGGTDEPSSDGLLEILLIMAILILAISINGFHRKERENRRPLQPVSQSKRNWRGSSTGRRLQALSKTKKNRRF